MKKAMIGVIAVVVAAVVGCTVYEVASKSNTTTTAIASSVSNSNNANVTESSTTEPSETASSTASSTEASSVNTKIKDTISSKTESSTTKVSDNANKTKGISSKTESSTTKSSVTQSSKTKSSTSASSSANSSSDGNIINGQPVLFNNNSQVSSYYGTWTVGDKIGAATVGDGASSTSPSGETLILTKSLYSFNGTVIEDPNYYIIATNASAYFGSEGWTGNVGASNGIISFIIAVPSNVKVTVSTIYKYETQLKVIENNGSLAVMNEAGTVYSASL